MEKVEDVGLGGNARAEKGRSLANNGVLRRLPSSSALSPELLVISRYEEVLAFDRRGYRITDHQSASEWQDAGAFLRAER